jgi:hypothetical protein
MTFERARAVADAVLFEGYALYPYRASSRKNQLRWQFGVLMPRDSCGSDPWWTETQVLIDGDEAVITGKLRFLRLRRRQVETAAGQRVDSLEVDGKLFLSWDEGELCELDLRYALGEGERVVSFELPGDRDEELVGEARVVRTRAPLWLRVTWSVEWLARGARLQVRTENLTAFTPASRDQTLPAAALGTHLLLGVEGGEFVSLTDPPEWAAAAAQECKNVGAWPVLAGEPGSSDLVLSAPIILYDHPRVAPESAGDLFDATEIDEILTLRTLTLTDEEKRQARATDAHVAGVIDRVDHLPPERLAQLHGAIRSLEPALQVGHRVRLKPGARRTDAQDMFLAGRVATVQAVLRDIDGRACVAVTVDDDPAAEINLWHGRYHYFHTDELEAMD